VRGEQFPGISSQCTADADGASGSSTLVGLGGGDDIVGDLLCDGLDLNELAVDLGLTVGVDLGILELELDEQIEDSDGNGLTVRALRLTLLPGDGGDEPLQEVILAESQCRFLGDDDDPDPDPGGDNDARNQSDISNTSNGTAVVETGDANAVGNISNTEIDQTADAVGGTDPADCDDLDDVDCDCREDPWARWFGGGVCAFGGASSVDQSATVVNSGSASANTGGNTAIGNNSTNVVTNTQTAAAADD
jgi:hypothetical protein